MARLYGLRLGLFAAATLCATMATAAPASYVNEYGGTFATASYDQIVVVGAAVDLPSFAMPAVIEHAKVERTFPAYRPRHASPRASGAAVRPTSLAGWRSGRTVRLAG